MRPILYAMRVDYDLTAQKANRLAYVGFGSLARRSWHGETALSTLKRRWH